MGHFSRRSIVSCGVCCAVGVVFLIALTPFVVQTQTAAFAAAMMQDLQEYVKTIRTYELAYNETVASVQLRSDPVRGGVTDWAVETMNSVPDVYPQPDGEDIEVPRFNLTYASGIFRSLTVVQRDSSLPHGDDSLLFTDAPAPQPFTVLPDLRMHAGMYVFGRDSFRAMGGPFEHNGLAGFQWAYLEPEGETPDILAVAKGPYIDRDVMLSTRQSDGFQPSIYHERARQMSKIYVPYDPSNGVVSHGYVVYSYTE